MIEALFGFIARLIALALGLAFVLLTTGVLQLRSAEKALLDPLTYQLALAETDTWLMLPDLVAAEAEHRRTDELAARARTGDMGAVMLTALDGDDLRELTTLLLPPAEAQRMVEAAIDDGLAYVEMRRDDVALDLTGLKRQAQGKAGAQASALLAEALPPCTDPSCPPPAEIAAALDVRPFIAGLPDRYPIVAAPGEPDPREDFAAIRTVFAFAPLALALLLAVVGLFGARSRAGWLRWTGVPLLLVGLLAIGQGGMADAGIDLAWSQYRGELDGTLSPAVVQHLRAVFEAVVAELVRHLQFEGGALALAGFALLLASFFVPDRRPHGS